MKKPQKKYDEVNYWESMTDSMIGLLLCILLVTMLLILFVVRADTNDFVDDKMGDSYEQDNDFDGYDENDYANVDDERGDDFGHDDPGNDWGEGGAGGSGGGASDDDHEFMYEDPDPGAGEGEGTDRAAVMVQLVDGETGRTVKIKGVEFELYDSRSALQVLSVYYPKKTDYSKFQTEETGTFYLPEKIALKSYTLHELSTIEGYDLPENTEFSLNEMHEWSDPYVVNVTINPSKGKISLQLTDAANGEVLTGASFKVIADEDITTKDGTTRYTKETVVGNITVDDKGYGEINNLYLGKYRIEQSVTPEFYGRITEPVKVDLKSKSNDANSIAVAEEKTSVNVLLNDALSTTNYIEGAEFVLLSDAGAEVATYKTDSKGRFTVTNLKKNTTYHLRQKTTAEYYIMNNYDYDISVSADGTINDNVIDEMNLTNRMIRITVGVKDKLFRGQISDINVALYDSNGEIVEVWNTTAIEKTIEGLDPGEYMVVIGGDVDNGHKILVENETEIQQFSFDKLTTTDIGSVAGMAVVGIGLIIAIVMIVSRRRREKE